MTPTAVLATCPDELLRRDPQPQQQTKNATALAWWLLDRGCRPSLLEIEQERHRRASDAA